MTLCLFFEVHFLPGRSDPNYLAERRILYIRFNALLAAITRCSIEDLRAGCFVFGLSWFHDPKT
jgi:hypothetical protein